MTDATNAETMGLIDFTRQRDWFDPTQHPNAAVTMCGVGGIGSPAALALSKLGIANVALVDPDIVEAHNLPNQMYPYYASDSKQSKVEALAEWLDALAPATEFTTFDTPFQAQPQSLFDNSIVIAGLDSMDAREELWRTRVRMKIRVPLFIDARLGGENIRLFCINPMNLEDVAYYEDTLHSDEEAVANVCTRQSIIDVGFMVASLISRAVRLHYAGTPPERETYVHQGTLSIQKG